MLNDKGLCYVPVLTPCPCKDLPTTPRFTDEEFFKYEERFHEGNDLPDESFQIWKQMYGTPLSKQIDYESSSDSMSESSSAGRITCDISSV